MSKSIIITGKVYPLKEKFNFQKFAINNQLLEKAEIIIYIRIINSFVIASTQVPDGYPLVEIRSIIDSSVDELVSIYAFLQQKTYYYVGEAAFSMDLDAYTVEDNQNYAFSEENRLENSVFPNGEQEYPLKLEIINNKFFTRAAYELRQSDRQRDYTALHCKMAIESVRNYFQGKKDAQRWHAMRTALNLTEDTLKSIDPIANNQRHGKNQFQSWENRKKQMQIGWEVVWRFYRLLEQELKILDKKEFPVF